MDERYLDHFNHPRNVGTLDDPHGTASVENPVCGDRIRVALRLEGHRVAEVKFRVLGCSGAIASASAMSELAVGLTVSEAKALGREAIDAALGGLPTLKRHGADLAIEGLRTALEAASRPGAMEA